METHYDPETDSVINVIYHKTPDGWCREVSRPEGLPETELWKRLTKGGE
jgi:hypothetical protein